MITEITDNNGKKPTGWIFFDAGCRFCVANRRRFGPLFERRGFIWLPLQTPGAAERLGITDQQLREAMWLQLANGQKVGGVNAWSVLMRAIWWMWPLGFVLALPGFNAAGDVVYRWVARNRYCLGGACVVPPRGKGGSGGRHRAFFEMP